MRYRPSFVARAAIAAGLVSIMAAAPAAAEYRYAEVEGWTVSHTPLAELREMGSSPVGPDMRRAVAGYSIDYRVVGGLARELTIQRLNCGDATDGQGGIAFTERVYHVADEAALVEAVRAQLRTLDSGYDEYCPARPAELAEALAGLEPALARVERWAGEDPLPPIEAWDRSPGEVRRTEPPVSITWSSSYVEPGVRVELESCGDSFFAELVQVDPAGDPAARAAQAREALAGLLRRAEIQCRLHSTQAARLMVGFDEAVADAETQLLALEDE